MKTLSQFFFSMPRFFVLMTVFVFFTSFLFAAPSTTKKGNAKNSAIKSAKTEEQTVANPATEEYVYQHELGPFYLNDDTYVLGDEYVKSAIKNYSPMMNNDIIAFYGHPKTAVMGIVGQYKLPELDKKLVKFAASYDEANAERGVIPALYLIYGTCWPEGEIGYLNSETTKEYIEYALERGWLVFLDHQIGKYTVEESMNKLLPFLKYPNVHLALDPEWHTTKPMQEIGSVTADDLNQAQQMMQDYLIANDLPMRRMLVVHQFKPWMISQRDNVKTDFERVNLIHCADGFGNPHQKKASYKSNAEAKNIPLKSFKLFSKPAIAGAGYDDPMMTPEEVLALEPRPVFIMIQ